MTPKPSSLRARIALLDGRIPADPDTLCCLETRLVAYYMGRGTLPRPYPVTPFDFPDPPEFSPELPTCTKTGGSLCAPALELSHLTWTRLRQVALDMADLDMADLDEVHPPPRP
jgi:hypothetical protein